MARRRCLRARRARWFGADFLNALRAFLSKSASSSCALTVRAWTSGARMSRTNWCSRRERRRDRSPHHSGHDQSQGLPLPPIDVPEPQPPRGAAQPAEQGREREPLAVEPDRGVEERPDVEGADPGEPQVDPEAEVVGLEEDERLAPAGDVQRLGLTAPGVAASGAASVSVTWLLMRRSVPAGSRREPAGTSSSARRRTTSPQPSKPSAWGPAPPIGWTRRPRPRTSARTRSPSGSRLAAPPTAE